MKNETIGTTGIALSIIAIVLSIFAIGMFYINQSYDVDVSGIASNEALIASLVGKINSVGNDVSNIHIPSVEVDGDDLENLEDDLNDDINDLEDEIEDLQTSCCIDGLNGIDGTNGIDGEDGVIGTNGEDGADGSDCDMSIFTCMKECSGWDKVGCMQDCIPAVA